jgi:hypothetical protein
VSVTYEVTTVVRPSDAAGYERYMRERHVPDLLETGHFTGASFSRSAPGRYRARYEARSAEALERYLAEDAPRLRAHARAHLPEGAEVTREVWTVLQSYEARVS